MSEYDPPEYDQNPVEEEEDDGNTTTVQFIAVSAEEHERMVREGELPETIQGADVHMTIGGNEAQPVRLIAVDSNGVPVTDPAILQAAAEQAGIMFVAKDENNEENAITIDQAMQVSLPAATNVNSNSIYVDFKRKSGRLRR